MLKMLTRYLKYSQCQFPVCPFLLSTFLTHVIYLDYSFIVMFLLILEKTNLNQHKRNEKYAIFISRDLSNVMFIVDCRADFAPFAVYFVDIYQLLDSAVSVYLINYRISGWSIIR